MVVLMLLFLLLCLSATIGFAFLDAWYLLRFSFIYVCNRWARPKTEVLQEAVMYSQVLPSDLDFLGHMNNARYSREADFARYSYMFECGLLQTIWSHSSNSMLMASSCRFRRSLKALDRFTIRTRLLGWNDNAFFLEQRFVSCSDGFVCAVLLAQHHVSGLSPSKVIQIMCGKEVESPKLPEDVHHWVKSNQVNSERLKKDHQETNKSN